jgi:hypothetical protein
VSFVRRDLSRNLSARNPWVSTHIGYETNTPTRLHKNPYRPPCRGAYKADGRALIERPAASL